MSEVVCVGVITMDTVALVDRYPDSDERVVAEQIVRSVGGPAAVASIALARLGISVAIVGTVLMALFVFAIGQAWARGLPINCGCFGNGGITADGKVHNWTYLSEILRDLGLILCGIYISRNPIGKFALDKEESSNG